MWEVVMMFDKTAKPTILKRLLISLSKKQKIIAISVTASLFLVGTSVILISYLFPPLKPITQSKSSHEVFGFAPYWTFHKLDNVDFNVLTTFAYFGIAVNGDGTLEKSGPGYDTFESEEATEVFKKAHAFGTRVVLTLTQMKNDQITTLLDDPNSQSQAIDQAVALIKERGIDGVNIDFEYIGDPGQEYRDKYSSFVANMTSKMHQQVPSSKVTVSVYASSVKNKRLYDIANLGQKADGVFMMAYDFAASGSDNAIPTAPLYGYKEGKYWYDVSTAVDDFLTQMPADKLILGVPWYGYNYAVDIPEVKAATNKGYYEYYKKSVPSGKKGQWVYKTYSYFVPYNSKTQTYSVVQDDITPETAGISSYQQGWDDFGKVSYKSYYSETDGIYRIVFIDDVKSLNIKYDFAKIKNLGGVGIWALGFDGGRDEMWHLLAEKFGTKLADNSVYSKQIMELESRE